MVKFFVLSRFIARFYKSNIVFLYFLVTSHNFTVYFQKGFFMINSNTFSNFNSKYPIYADLHTHSISSGHGSEDTITDMIRCASESGLSLFGISDHGPATSSSAKPSYFQSLKLADRDRFGIRVLYGAELNIINTAGDVDLDDFFPDEQLDSTMVGKSQNEMSLLTFEKSKQYANKKYKENEEGIHSGKLNYMFLEISKEVRRKIQPIGK